MEDFVALVGQFGLLIVLACVLLEQLGLPVPAYLVLVVSGSAAAAGQLSLPAVLAAAVLACLWADLSWYGLGRRQGERLLGLMARASLLPPPLAARVHALSARWGLPALLVARFVPGLSGLLTVFAGHARTPRMLFLLCSAAGATAWAGSALAIGWYLSAQQQQAILGLVATAGPPLVLLVATGAAVFCMVRRMCK